MKKINNFKNLLQYKKRILHRGGIFRVHLNSPHEKILDFMIFDSEFLDYDGNKFGLIVRSGPEAGKILCILPDECLSYKLGISKKWIILNWNKYVYDCCVKDVFYLSDYEIN